MGDIAPRLWAAVSASLYPIPWTCWDVKLVESSSSASFNRYQYPARFSIAARAIFPRCRTFVRRARFWFGRWLCHRNYPYRYFLYCPKTYSQHWESTASSRRNTNSDDNLSCRYSLCKSLKGCKVGGNRVYSHDSILPQLSCPCQDDSNHQDRSLYIGNYLTKFWFNIWMQWVCLPSQRIILNILLNLL